MPFPTLTPAGVILSALNHLLKGEEWARQRLLPYAGQTARVEGGPFGLSMTVSETGFFRSPASDEGRADVTITFPDDAPFRVLTDPASMFAAARLAGAANFAETLAFVFRNLRWDYEGDLADMVGDIPARRLARLLADGAAWQRAAARRLGTNLAEYASEESALLIPAHDMRRFASEVDQLRDDLARLEKRVSRLLP